MAPLIIPALITAAGSIAGGLLGGPKNTFKPNVDAAVNVLNGVAVPSIEEQKVQLEKLVQMGVLTPEEMQLFLQDPTQMEQISVDPRFREAQTNALAKMQDIVAQGGLTATDKARLQDIFDLQNVEERGSREAIEQNARERGIGGSDFSLASKLIAGQGSANRAARQGMDVAALAEQRALDALKSTSEMGRSLETQEYGQQADKARAQDIINQFNTSNKQNVGNMNTGARNVAQQVNLGEKQRVSDVNIGNQNVNAIRNADLIQQKFANEMDKAKAKAAAYVGAAGPSQTQSNMEYASKLGAIGTGANALANLYPAMTSTSPTSTSMSIGNGNTTDPRYNNPYMLPSDVMNKEDISPADVEIDEFMSTLQPYKYKYKEPSMGEGEHTGIMANDMAKSPTGAKIVVSTPKGLAIDTNKGFGVLAAAIGRLNKKLEEKQSNGL